MKHLPDGRIQCRVRINGSYNGHRWVYEDPEDDDGSQFIWPDGNPSEYWWSEGNMSCDCNRVKYTGLTPETAPELFHSDGACEPRCGEEICIDTLEPLEGDGLPILWLSESQPSHPD